MITFTSLFLGLVLGVHPVEMLAGERVAEVEVFLDGHSLGVRGEAPWTIDCDFGPRLLPHELVAVGRDAAGREVSRARQWVNLPRRRAEVTLTLAGGDAETARRVRLDWTAVAGEEPRAIEVLFDGVPLTADDPRSIPLPRHDPADLHYLRAEVDFGAGPAAVSELVFGGTYADRVESEITAVPLALERPGRRRTAATMEGWLVRDGAPLEIAAVDRGLADLVVVGDRGAHDALDGMWRGATEMIFTADPDLRVEFVFPVAERPGTSGDTYTLFPHSQKLAGKAARLPDVLFGVEPPPTPGTPRLADAVAVAGVTAASSNLRRAVLLLLSEESADASDLSAEVAREYLEALRVPLFVWSLRREPPQAARSWGPVFVADDRQKLQVASRMLLRELDRQRMVWVVGRHLPQRIELGPAARGARLAGAAPPAR